MEGDFRTFRQVTSFGIQEIIEKNLKNTPLSLSNTEEIPTLHTLDHIINGVKQKQLHGKFFKDLFGTRINNKMLFI